MSSEKGNVHYLLGVKPEDSHVKSHASRTADEECAYMIPTLLDLAKSVPKLRLLDVGCGPGSITCGLARLVPGAEVVGLDMSETVLEAARMEANSQGVTNVNHRCIAHLQHHVSAINELARVSRKGGGRLCMREGILPTFMWYPLNPTLDEAWRAIMAAYEANGALTDAGRRLKAWAVEAGVLRETICVHGRIMVLRYTGAPEALGAAWPARVSEGSLAERVVDIGAASRERLTEYAEAWRQWIDDEDGLFMLMHGQVIARF
ncbi:hypothetical protein BAUCODRAFT_122602 [Baudoinia panamericana UAMH 10762]|uniref:Methyltransferase domain-containing protein n=1 Tax=Baudoinia panamericana (strain UAMH 10762) TaxID=717646 RepID=M2NBT4_BAUPA|nr:uncharacterized protein BAUCODRAFT_122602 [Baudoinia panamericana UAMH 10762]EMC96614.1 hypothetical protein BAUCODRAFT_122602 [Baudoinia panamericana UAMH 10762]